MGRSETRWLRKVVVDKKTEERFKDIDKKTEERFKDIDKKTEERFKDIDKKTEERFKDKVGQPLDTWMYHLKSL